ncbi:hypothetical protein SLS60_008571 [Paraconiothyrium brasiliense]|uniref:Uncharacterized protein n=1 Tax=Paraconiothyrium brasiliense TaxID=300254 RepID=A0ABR3QXU6_9PLEO
MALLDARKNSEYRSQRFRYVRVNGAFTESDQNRSLWFYAEARKLHGMSEARTLELGEQYRDVCQTFVVKPGGVATQGAWAMECVGKMLGDGMVIGHETLGAFVADLVVRGEEEEGTISNKRMVEKGSTLLRDRAKGEAHTDQ